MSKRRSIRSPAKGVSITSPPFAFQAWFQHWKTDQEWSLREIASKIQAITKDTLAANNVWHWLHGTNVPHEAHQEALARLAGVPVEEIARLVWEQRRQRRLYLEAQRAGSGQITVPRATREARRTTARALAGSLRPYAKGTLTRDVRSRVKREVARAAAAEGASD